MFRRSPTVNAADELVSQTMGILAAAGQDCIDGLLYITSRCNWYLDLSLSSVLRRSAALPGQGVSPFTEWSGPPIRGLLVELFSSLLEYQMRS